jgi:hypothetical protein
VPEPECSPEGTVVRLTGGDAAMGLRTLSMELVNCGTEPYTVEGYPSLRLFDEDHEPISVVVGHGSAGIATVPEFDKPPQVIVLQPGERALSGLLWRNLVTDSTVKATTAYHMDAAVSGGEPWQTVPLVVPDTVRGADDVTVDLGNTGKVGVQAWQKATTPSSTPPSTPVSTSRTVDPA